MFVSKVTAQKHEADQLGIIHHSNYGELMEEARVRCMVVLVLGYREMEQQGVQTPVSGVSIDYKQSFRFDDVAEIRVFVTKYNGAVLELGYEFVNVDSGEICTKAASRHGFIKDGKLVSLKKALPELDQKIREYVGKEK